MKRLLFFFDGTWRGSDAPEPSHVLRLCSGTRISGSQIVFYHPGVGSGYGTGRTARLIDRYLGGGLGSGMQNIVEEAYRHLVLNYSAGCEIFFFGWSRGAYIARRMVDVLRASGLVERDKLHEIKLAVNNGLSLRWRGQRTFPDSTENLGFRARHSRRCVTSPFEQQWRMENKLPEAELLTIRYVGLWDCVSAMGIPKALPTLRRLVGQGSIDFHDHHASSMIRSLRHALAIDETRRLFPPSTFDNLKNLREAFGEGDNTFEERWFAGVHTDIGGGNGLSRLSAPPFVWIVEAAVNAGMELNGWFLEDMHSGTDWRGTDLGDICWLLGLTDVGRRRRSPRLVPFPLGGVCI
ncbi:DUF2235 domain-containing protein [Sedimentitalea sp. JM2-8]|uniref:DUF2235 domain-containing protein n=1 Tax=Sedimentitalea xiamensis TaxID=3050037 RepID=A0ABT7FJF4_9RHOB|nr:DUF2235 domain-containing protein [Sedimentitalea xiamensis]MDK3075246.1 DUF2235 domain-containing protein [Sedimentitalea xiamensis]